MIFREGWRAKELFVIKSVKQTTTDSIYHEKKKNNVHVKDDKPGI